MSYVAKTLGHSVQYTLANVLVQGADFLMLPFYTRVMSVEQVGIIAILASLLGFLNIVFRQGIISAVSKFYFDFKEEGELNRYLGTLVTYLTLSGAAIALVGSFLAPLLAEWLRIDPLLVIFVMVIAYVNALTTFYQMVLTTKERSRTFLGNKFFQTATVVTSIVFFTLFYQASALGKLTGELMGAGVVVLVSLFLLVVGDKIKPTLGKLSHITRSIGFGLPVQLAGLGWWGMVNIDRFFLNHFISTEAVATYSVAYAAALSINLFSTGFNQAWSVFYFKNHKLKNFVSESVGLIKQYVGWLVMLLLTVLLFSRELVLILGGTSYLAGIKVVPWVALAAILYGLYFVPSRKLFVSDRTWSLVLVTGAGLVANIVANFILVPTYGMMGAAYATAIAYLVSLLVTLYITGDWAWLRAIKRPIQFLAVALAVIFLVQPVLFAQGPYLSFLTRFLVWGVGLVLAWRHRIFDWEVARQFLVRR